MKLAEEQIEKEKVLNDHKIRLTNHNSELESKIQITISEVKKIKAELKDKHE